MHPVIRFVAALALVAGLALTAAAAVAQDASPTAGPMPMGGSGAAFMTIVNSGAEADRLVSAKSDVSETVEVHEMKMGDDGVMHMSPLAHGLDIPAGATVALEPGGYHIMFIGLKQDFTEGFSYELTLTFEKAGDLTITVPVLGQAPGASEGSPATTAGSISVSNQWSRVAPAMGGATPGPVSTSTGAAFMTIVNGGSEADRLVSAKTDAAATVEVHEVKAGDDGTMKMSPLMDGLDIPAGETVVLKPGSYHIMLFGLKQDFTEGFSYDLTLTFEKAGDVTITVPVLTAEPTDAEAAPTVTAGSITVSKQWSRPAPAMQGGSGMGNGNMGNGHGAMGNGTATPEAGS